MISFGVILQTGIVILNHFYNSSKQSDCQSHFCLVVFLENELSFEKELKNYQVNVD